MSETALDATTPTTITSPARGGGPGHGSLLWRQFVIEWKLYARDRMAMFWTFAFPLLMLFGFGTIFRGGGPPAPTIVRVAPAYETPQDRALVAALKKEHLKVLTLPPGAAEARWAKGETAAQLETAGGGYRLRLNSYLLAQGYVTAQAANLAFLEAQAHLAKQPEPARIPTSVESPGHAHSNNYAAFLLPGLVGLNLMSMGLFSVGMVLVSYREKGKFRRLAVTPLPKWVFLLGQVLHRATVVGLQTALVLIGGWLGFGIVNQGSYLAFIVLLALGAGTFMAMGFALTGFAETAEGYAPIANLFFFSMMLLSGVYFTLDAAPRWIQKFVYVLPLSPYLKALRAVFNDGASLAGHGVGLAVVAAWGVLCFLVAVKKFRWA